MNQEGTKAEASVREETPAENRKREDPFRPTKGRTELAEAGPPGKRPDGNESARLSILFSRQLFQKDSSF
nr:hypothetical protein [Alkalicoccus halolimnae]TXF86417.1 hypothetical protein FTX54_04095 [Alkalicoccus halolimnae]